MVAPRRRRFQFRLPYPLPAPQLSPLFTRLLVAASLTVLWMLRSTKGFWTTVTSVISIRVLYNLVAGGYIRRFRGWYAATYFPSVDLQQLCDSYHEEGEMGLPRELINEIMRYNDRQTLESCSLTSRAFYSAARPFVHSRMALGIRSLVHGSHSVMAPRYGPGNWDQADVFHACHLSAAEERGLLRYGYVREVHLDLGVGNPEKVLQLQHLLALGTVHTLTIQRLDLHKILPIFDRCFSQFVPTVRSLGLESTHCDDANQLLEFACRFPHLDDLKLVNPCGPGDSLRLVDAPSGSKGPRPQRPLPFGGHLVLRGGSSLVQCLLDLPGGIRFRSIEIDSDQKDSAKLLVACSSTLEVLNICCFESCFPPDTRLREHGDWRSRDLLRVDLGCNRVLRRFKLTVDFAELDILPPFLHKTLTSISSPHFSEFSLRLCRGWHDIEPKGGGNHRRVWGTGWELVDEDLYEHAVRRDGFRFTVEIVTGLSTMPVEVHFPRMKSKGSLLITHSRR